MLPLPYKGDQCKPFHFTPHSQSCAFSHKTALTPSWISAHSPSISYPAYFLPSFRAFLYGDYPKEMLPVLCWRAEIWTQPIVVEQVRHCWPCLLTRTTDPGIETRYEHPPRAWSAKGTGMRLPSVSGSAGGRLAMLSVSAARSRDHLDSLGWIP